MCKEELRGTLGNSVTYQVFAAKQTAFPVRKVSPHLPQTYSEVTERSVLKCWPAEIQKMNVKSRVLTAELGSL